MAMVFCSGVGGHETGRALGFRPSIEAMATPPGCGDHCHSSGGNFLVYLVALEKQDAGDGVNAPCPNRGLGLFLARLLSAAVVVTTISSCNREPSKSLDCENACQIDITGLRKTYSAESSVEVVIVNRAANDLEVNVAVEGNAAGKWTVVVGSVSDPGRSFAKMVKLKILNKGSSFALKFVPCETQMILRQANDSAIKKPTGMLVLRLRVDAYSRSPFGPVQRVRSPQFTVSCD
jgi:hypothetical protein